MTSEAQGSGAATAQSSDKGQMQISVVTESRQGQIDSSAISKANAPFILYIYNLICKHKTTNGAKISALRHGVIRTHPQGMLTAPLRRTQLTPMGSGRMECLSHRHISDSSFLLKSTTVLETRLAHCLTHVLHFSPGVLIIKVIGEKNMACEEIF